MNPWRTFFLWLFLSIVISTLLIIVFHTIVVLAVLLIPLGFFFSHSRAKPRNVPPTERDQKIEPK